MYNDSKGGDPMDNKNIFARNLQMYMDINGKSRKDVSEAIGVSYYTFTDWVKGKKYPRMDKVEKLASYFGILKSDLIEEKEKPTAQDDELSIELEELIDCIKKLPEDKIQMLLQVAKSIR